MNLVLLLLALFSASANAAPLFVLIPGSGSSADRIYLDGLQWSEPFFKSNRYFGLYADTLKAEGFETVVCPKIPDQDSRPLAERAADCVTEILTLRSACPQQKARSIHLVGHSMGGLIARLIAQTPKVKNCINSVTTISTPHRGTPLADFVIDHRKLDEASIDLYGRLARISRFTPDRKRYIPELRVDRRGYAAALFKAQDTPNNPKVRYFSISNAIDRVDLHPLQLSRFVLARELRKRGLDRSPYSDRNDGIVPEYSMIHGKLVGRLEVDHWSSACLDPIKASQGCSLAQALVLPHLRGLARNP